MADENRDGIDDNIDRRQGNSRDSASYARIYDPRSENEYTNLLEIQNRLEATRRANIISNKNNRDLEAARAAQNDVHFFPSVGKFIIPETNTWAGHAKIVLDNDSNLFFNPEKYVYFDKIIAEKLSLPALTDKEHPDFAKYRGLRTNLEVLRNDIIGQYLRDGAFNPGDEVYIPKIKAIAETLGDALANDVWWKRPFVKYLSLDAANVEAVGASELYKFLLKEQDSQAPGLNMRMGLRDLVGLPDNYWGLRNLEDTPFSPQALAAPLVTLETQAEPPAAELELLPEERKIYARECDKLIETCCGFNNIDTLNVPTKKNAVEDGRTIIRWLRNLEFGDRDVQEWLSAGSPPEQIAKADALSRLVMIYAGQMVVAKRDTPAILDHVDVHHGGDATGGIAMMIAEHALSLLPEDSAEYKALEARIDAMPKAHFERSKQSLSRLLDHVETGLSELTATPTHDKTPHERLLKASLNIRSQARQLRSVDTLERPKREESVELGREILRKLRALIREDKPLAEAVETGSLTDKLSLVQKLDEMVEIYKTLLAEVAQADPGIMDDPRIKEANDAVGGFSHAISLMASKEIPSSVASAQKISADVTQDPAEWKQLHEHTVGRLIKSMEGGLEAAVQDLEQQQAEQQQDDEQSQQQAESALLQSDQSRRRRRRRRQQKSGMSGKASDKKMRDIMADDAAAGQGRFNTIEMKPDKYSPTTSASAYMGLKASDIAAISSIGISLRDIGNQGIGLSMSTASANEPFKPNSKSAAEVAIDAIKQPRGNRNQPRK